VRALRVVVPDELGDDVVQVLVLCNYSVAGQTQRIVGVG
jgi:hypothetical protein